MEGMVFAVGYGSAHCADLGLLMTSLLPGEGRELLDVRLTPQHPPGAGQCWTQASRFGGGDLHLPKRSPDAPNVGNIDLLMRSCRVLGSMPPSLTAVCRGEDYLSLRFEEMGLLGSN